MRRRPKRDPRIGMPRPAKELYDSGDINKLEWKLYNQWYYWLIDKTPSKPTGIIYLKCDPIICQKRIKKRERKEECSIPLEYLKNIHNKHEEWINSIKLSTTPVLSLDVNEDFEENPQRKEFLVQEIKKFLNKI